MTYAVPFEPAPMNEINTTPLIDVMLVLLIMVIVTIPMQSHVVKVDLPAAPVTIQHLKNKVVVTEDDRLLWNGQPVTLQQLQWALAEVQRLPQPPELQLQPEPAARYALVDEVLAVTKRAEVRAMGFVGNERYASF